MPFTVCNPCACAMDIWVKLNAKVANICLDFTHCSCKQLDTWPSMGMGRPCTTARCVECIACHVWWLRKLHSLQDWCC